MTVLIGSYGFIPLFLLCCTIYFCRRFLHHLVQSVMHEVLHVTSTNGGNLRLSWQPPAVKGGKQYTSRMYRAAVLHAQIPITPNTERCAL